VLSDFAEGGQMILFLCQFDQDFSYVLNVPFSPCPYGLSMDSVKVCDSSWFIIQILC
jgi:hypothetical protein